MIRPKNAKNRNFECELSVVIPAFEEAKRLPPHLETIRQYLLGKPGGYEVIVVDDGGQDGTADLVQKLRRDWSQLKLMRHSQNIGKGAALRTGLAAARGRSILMTDADGATPITEEKRLRAALIDGADIAVGSRLLTDIEVRRNRHPIRYLLGYVFAAYVRRFLALPVSDPQCGFKMLRAEIAQELLPACDEPGYLFDAQLLLYATRRGFRIADVPVSWREIPGSKVRRFRDGWRMLRGLVRIRRRTRRTISINRHFHGRSDPSCRKSHETRPSGSE